MQAAGEQSERTPLLTESAQGAAPSKAVEASATNQEALAAAPAGTDISSAGTEEPTSTEAPASSGQQPGMQRQALRPMYHHMQHTYRYEERRPILSSALHNVFTLSVGPVQSGMCLLRHCAS